MTNNAMTKKKSTATNHQMHQSDRPRKPEGMQKAP
jgi:hypothetical protein